jgi:tRNA A37 N6-isopentenylltransferase MiaA
MRLQTARQGKNEDPQAFADRCRALAQKIVQKSDDPQAQRIHQENVERMLLASFVAGLFGAHGRQVRYANPQAMKQALTIALSVQEAEKQERFNESFYANLMLGRPCILIMNN